MRIWLTIAALMGAIGVVIGAIGAHAIKGLAPTAQHAFDTATAFHMYHALAMGLAALAIRRNNRGWARLSAALFLVGIALFCGSLYAWALTQQHFLMFLTPLGGMSFIGGWLALAFAGWRSQET